MTFNNRQFNPKQFNPMHFNHQQGVFMRNFRISLIAVAVGAAFALPAAAQAAGMATGQPPPPPPLLAARLAALSPSARAMPAAAPAVSSGSNRYPSQPWSNTSGTPPKRQPVGTSPEAMDS